MILVRTRACCTLAEIAGMSLDEVAHMLERAGRDTALVREAQARIAESVALLERVMAAADSR